MRILLVRLRQIGDVVFTTPAIRALRERFPDARLTYVVEPAAAPVVAHNPHLDDVVVAPRAGGLRGVAADLKLGVRLRAECYDLAIDFHGGPRASLLTWLSGARERLGYDVVGRGWMYTRRVARPRGLRPRHSVENQWDLLESLGVAPPDRSGFPMEMPVRSAPWRGRGWITEWVEPGELPCRPCDQRVCEPGDFRCLTSITPQHVIDACERALVRRLRLQADRGPAEAGHDQAG